MMEINKDMKLKTEKRGINTITVIENFFHSVDYIVTSIAKSSLFLR